MPEFSKVSCDRLDTCHEDLQLIFSEVVRLFDCSILEGHRGHDRQQLMFQKRLSQVEWPDSKHNPMPSMAVDVAPYPIDWEDEGRFYMFAGWVMCVAMRLFEKEEITHMLRWGGDWNRNWYTTDQSFFDGVHFELVPT